MAPTLGVFLDLDSLSFGADSYSNHREPTGDQPLTWGTIHRGTSLL